MVRQSAQHSHKNNTKGVIPYLAVEPDEFDTQVERYRKGEIDDTAFTPWRLRRGVYGQRQPDAQMMRIKVPGGLVNAEQLETLAEVAEHYAPLKRGHITTRENIQYHHVKLEHAATVMRLLGAVGLTTREACGNTVRNTIADPLVGIDPRQAFDVTPYLVAFVRYFVRHPVTQSLPRKIKPAFSSGEHDPSLVQMHDIGFVARIREIDGIERKGFKIVVGGGTSIMAKLAETLYEFIPVEEYLKVSEAVLRIFDRSEELRANKMMARIKVLIHRRGMDAFRQEVEQELEEPWAAQGDFDPTPLMAWAQEVPPPLPSKDAMESKDPSFWRWRQTNVVPQLQAGYFAATAKVPRGDLDPQQFRSLADLARQFGSGTAALSPEQNLVIRWVPEAYLLPLWQGLERLGLGESGAFSITDITSCPGTDSCKLGITSSMGLNRALADALEGWDDLLADPSVQNLHIKASGCPNGCGRHHLANIGFHGATIKGAGGQQVPAYELFLAGAYDAGEVRYGERVRTKVPAKEVPAAVRRVLDHYRDHRAEGEQFNDFVVRVGTGPFEAILGEFREVPAVNRDSLSYYMDWGKTVLYRLERGEGECSV